VLAAPAVNAGQEPPLFADEVAVLIRSAWMLVGLGRTDYSSLAALQGGKAGARLRRQWQSPGCRPGGFGVWPA
jgi:hypothetical protein